MDVMAGAAALAGDVSVTIELIANASDRIAAVFFIFFPLRIFCHTLSLEKFLYENMCGYPHLRREGSVSQAVPCESE
jgi:hypothetical protein